MACAAVSGSTPAAEEAALIAAPNDGSSTRPTAALQPEIDARSPTEAYATRSALELALPTSSATRASSPGIGSGVRATSSGRSSKLAHSASSIGCCGSGTSSVLPTASIGACAGVAVNASESGDSLSKSKTSPCSCWLIDSSFEGSPAAASSTTKALAIVGASGITLSSLGASYALAAVSRSPCVA